MVSLCFCFIIILTSFSRNFELANLKWKHYQRGLQTEDAFKVEYDEYQLEQRKGWINKLNKEGGLESMLIHYLSIILFILSL